MQAPHQVRARAVMKSGAETTGKGRVTPPMFMKSLKVGVVLSMVFAIAYILHCHDGTVQDTSPRLQEQQLLAARAQAGLYGPAPTSATDYRGSYDNDPSHDFGFLDYSPTSYLLDDGQFIIFYTILLGTTCVITGIGLEYHVGTYFVPTLSKTNGLIPLWKGAQLVFPLLVSVGGAESMRRSFLGLPLAVIGLYKLGFPEITSFIYYAVYKEDFLLYRFSLLLNGMSSFVHHAASLYFLAGLATGVIMSDRHTQIVIMPLICQHWVPLLKYHHTTFYIAVEICLELWWELELFAHIKYFPFYAQTIGFCMLCAHWGYFIAAGIGMLNTVVNGSTEEDVLPNGLLYSASLKVMQKAKTPYSWNIRDSIVEGADTHNVAAVFAEHRRRKYGDDPTRFEACHQTYGLAVHGISKRSVSTTSPQSATL